MFYFTYILLTFITLHLCENASEAGADNEVEHDNLLKKEPCLLSEDTLV